MNAASASSSWSARWPTLAPFALALATVAAYAASLRGGFLNYDDDWLIQNNPLLARRDLGALAAIWTDLSDATRMKLGAEYLPVRDTLEWLEARAYGLDPHAMRAMSLALYVGAVLLVRGWLRRALRAGQDPAGGLRAELAAWVFALHPVHAESVAWLAGRKDVLALLFVAGALHVYSGSSKRRVWAVPLLVTAACASKGVAVAAPLLLPVHDWLARRRVERVPVALSLLAALAVALVHVRVGATVQMIATPAGGSRLAAAATMGPVLLRYLEHAVFPAGLSVIYEVTPASPGAIRAWLGYAPLVAWLVLAVAALRRDDRLPAAALAIFVLTMAPTSQILFPLQNLMADRYLLLPMLGPSLLAGALSAWLLGRHRAARVPIVGLVVALGVVTALRAEVFSDSERLWRDATAKTRADSRAPYQLAMALEPRGDAAGAEAAYREALRRADGGFPRAISNLAILLAKTRRADEAIALLADAAPRFPEDPRLLGNLAELTARSGDEPRARALFDELLSRFPDYEAGRRNYQKRFGRVAPPTLTP